MNFDVLGVSLVITGGVLIGAAIRNQNPKDLVLEAFDFSQRKQGNVPTWADKKAAAAARSAGEAAIDAGGSAADVANEIYRQPINYKVASV